MLWRWLTVFGGAVYLREIVEMVGTAMSMEALYPDGKREVLSYANNFQWNWHNNYICAEDVAPLLPKAPW
jgi:hypothetical protein